MEKYRFVPGIAKGTELVVKSVINNYVASLRSELGDGFVFDVNFYDARVNIYKKFSFLQEFFNCLYIGRVDKYLAVKNQKSGCETVFCSLDALPYESGRIPFDFSVCPLRGVEYRKELRSAVKRNWKSVSPGEFIPVLDYGLCQVNNATDLIDQVYEFLDYNDKYRLSLAYVEGVTEMSDDDILSYDFMEKKPEGHEGGSYVFVDDERLEFSYPGDFHLSGSADCVWCLRGDDVCVFVNAEGHGYSKYVYLPADSDSTFHGFLRKSEEMQGL